MVDDFLKISLRAKAGVPKTLVKQKLRLHSPYFPQNTLMLTESYGNSVICVLFLDFVRLRYLKQTTTWTRKCKRCTMQMSYLNASERECFIGFPNARNIWNHEAAGRVAYCFRAFGNLMKHEARVFEITSPTKKISWNYHLNKFSQFNYYFWDVKNVWSSKKCVWCAWSYHLIAALWQFLKIIINWGHVT